MDRHLLIVANGFRYTGAVLGIPALILCLCLTSLWISVTLVTPKPTDSANTINIQRDGLVGILVAGGTVIGKAFQFFSDVSLWVLRALNIAAFALTLIGAALFFTGRGLGSHATWARIVAGLLSAGFFAVSFLAFASMRRGPNVLALLPVSAAVYTLWVLIRRFA